MTTVSQRQWHNTISSALDEQMRRNVDLRKNYKVDNPFVDNVGEARIMASDVNLYVVVDEDRARSD
eukprot:14336837-Ditylum_brightwellii.AAC.1